MKTQVSFYEFCRAFETGNRNNKFSYDGKKALFEYLEDYEEDTGAEMEFDMIALCCEYTEYENLAEFQRDYNKEDYPDIETIRDYTQVIELEDGEGFIIQAF